MLFTFQTPFAFLRAISMALPVAMVVAGSMPVKGQNGAVPSGVAGIAASEAQKRQQRVQAAQTLFTSGSKAFADQSYAEAMDYFKAAFETIPDVPAVEDQRQIFFKRYQASAYRFATILAAEAKWEESESTLAEVLAAAENGRIPRDVVDPEIRKMLGDLRNRDDRYNMATSPRHLRNVNLVESKLILANGYLELGDYDRAARSYNEVLAIDPYSTAARRGLENVERHRMNYFDAAFDHTRAKRLAEVTGSWESPVPTLLPGSGSLATPEELSEAGSVAIDRKLKEIIIPRIEFAGARLVDVVEYLARMAQELDVSEVDPSRRGVNIIIDSTGLPAGEDAGQRVLSMQLSNIPLGVALKYAAQQVGMVYRTDNFAVRVISMSVDDSGEMYSRTHHVPPGFITGTGAAGESSGGSADPFASPEPSSGGALVKRISAQQFLQERGVTFGPGATASFNAGTNTLVVRNTAQQQIAIENIIQAARDGGLKMVQVSVKIVSIQANLINQLGLDFLLGEFGVGSNHVFSGGTPGNSQNQLDPIDYPFNTPEGPLGLHPITSGLRTGNVAATSTIDAVIKRDGITSGSSVAPGVFSVAGVFTDPQFQGVLRALSQSKGTDLLSDAHVLVRPGQQAKIEQIREFIYPTEYDPPEIPNNITASGFADDDDLGVSPFSGVPVTPATPTAFETRNVGKTVTVEPTVSADNLTVSVNVILDFTEFSGFINYGSPVLAFGNVVTENAILMPVFDAIKETTNVTVWDGQTIVIGGFHGESVTTTQDKIPYLGDLPVLGRAFRSNTSDSTKRAITIFVTVRLVDPGGNLINAPPEE